MKINQVAFLILVSSFCSISSAWVLKDSPSVLETSVKTEKKNAESDQLSDLVKEPEVHPVRSEESATAQEALKVQPVKSEEISEDAPEEISFNPDLSTDLDLEDPLTSGRENFYVITAIFNPASYTSRFTLYNKFVLHMAETGAKLVTIECIFPKLNQTEFKVTSDSNPLHIQVKSDSIFWIKENLINYAAARLPPSAEYVAWLDADIHFHDSDWIDQTINALQNFSVVQSFKMANFLNAYEEIIRVDYSLGYSVVHNKPIDSLSSKTDWYPHPGYGWAMSKQTFDAIGGLPIYDIVGCGDLHFAYTLLNKIDITIGPEFVQEYRHRILDASHDVYEKLRQLADVERKSIVGYVPVTISHDWHGSRNDRQYVQRLKILSANNFNFFEDTEKGVDGLYRFVGNNSVAVQEDIRCYFENRNEDSEFKEKSGIYKCKFMAQEKLMEDTCPKECYDTVNSNQTPKDCSSSNGHYNSENGQWYGDHFYGGHWYGDREHKDFTTYNTYNIHNYPEGFKLYEIVDSNVRRLGVVAKSENQELLKLTNS